MRILRAAVECTAPCSAVTIGNFDGMHRGHQRLMVRVIELARELGCAPSVLTFDPHPLRLLRPERAPKLLQSMAQRLAVMETVGIKQVLVLRFDEALARMTAEEFVRAFLVEGLRARAVVVGENFRFGYLQQGDVTLLRRLGEQYGFVVETAELVPWRGETVSSSGVRRLVEQGDVRRAHAALGRPFTLEGKVVSGFGIGRRETVPTLNLQPDSELLPAHGVYVSRTADLDRGTVWPSITNVGLRPTFDGAAVTVETFLLGPAPGVAPARISVELLHRVREERKFASPAELKEQILRDVQRAQAWHRRYDRWVNQR